MRRHQLALAACLAVALLAPLGGAEPSSLALPVVQVRVPNPAVAAYVAGNFDETHSAVPGHVEIVLWPGDAARLAALGLTWKVVTPDLLTDPDERTGPGPLVALPGPDRDDYRHLADYEAELKDLAKRFPGLVRLLTLPNETLEGRTVYGVEIAANVAAKDGRPSFLVDGVHHAREWPAGEFPMIYAHQLANGYGRDKKITALLKKLRVYVVPVVNVDGFTYSRESPIGDVASAASQGAYWRKNRRSFTGVTAPVVGINPDAHGVDPNRNYGFMWGDDEGGSSDVQADETYRGSAAFSEPESRNIEKLLLAHPVTALVTNHTHGRLVMHPWGFTDEETPDADEKIFDAIGQRLADTMGGYENWSAIELYTTSGGSRDWAYGALNTLSYTFEHGTNFHPPYAAGVGDVWEDVLKAFAIAADAAANPRYHSVVTGRVVDGRGKPVPATLTLTKKLVNPLWEGNPSGEESVTETFSASTAAARNGAFTWHVNPSVRPQVEGAGNESYTLTVKYGGRTRTIRVVVRRGHTVKLGTIRL